MAERTPEEDIPYLIGRIAVLELLCAIVIENLPEERRRNILSHFRAAIGDLIALAPHESFSRGAIAANNILIELLEQVAERNRS